MTPIALAGPAVEPVTLAAAKRYLRLDGSEEDELVSALITAGRLTVERAARLALVEQSWRLRLQAWPPDRAVPVPLHPVIGVLAVRLVGAAGPPTVLAADLYRLDDGGDPVRLLVDPAAPDPAGALGAIEIDLACGFGATGAAVPEPLLQAIRIMVAHWFEHRGDDVARSGPALPPDARALMAPYLRPRLA